jgi:ABC-2 type transport system ATP-binding protein
MTNILEVRTLVKHYNQVAVVNGISFTVKHGICFGLLGPNGAGKTTTIEMIEGITEPSAGEILYKGKPRNPHFAQEAGIQFQETALMDFLTVKETLGLFASLYQKSLPLDEVIQLCDLAGFIEQRSTRLSGGQRQRLLLALALINDPEIIFLDEPTTGLDPQSRRNFWALIQNIKAKGKTIILTTHYMDEAQLLCDELLIIDQGKIIAQGSPAQLLAEHFQHHRVTLDSEAFTLDRKLCRKQIIDNNGKITLLTDSPEKTIAFLIAHHIDINSISIGKPNLEDLFIKLTGHQLRQ